MRALRSETVFQAGGLVAWAVVGLAMSASIAGKIESELVPAMPAEVPPPVYGAVTGVLWVITIAVFLAFGLAFRASTREVQPVPPRRRAVLLLVVQLALAMMMSTDFLFILAAEVPFVLAGRAAAAWMGGQALVTVVSGLAAAGGRGFEPLAGLSHLPQPLVVGLTLLSVLAWQGLAFCGGYLAATETRSRRELSRVNAELEATQDLLAGSSRMAERTHIARELHDTMGHHLAALSVNLELARQVAEGRAVRPVEEAHAVARSLLADVRDAVGALRLERPLELRRAIETLVAGIVQPHVALTFPADLAVRDPVQAHVLFRCVQEALTNAVRHAGAGKVWIELSARDGGVALEVRDDGRGAARVRPGNGLSGMRERVEEAGGRLDVTTQPGRGFTITAWLPGSEAA